MNNDQKESLVNLGFSSAHVDSILSGIKVEGGLTIVSGTTHSGKSTTLMALRQTVVDDKRAIENSGSSYDPDMFFLHEMRDSDSVEAYAETARIGQSMFAEMHASSALSAISRLRLFERGMTVQAPELKVSLSIHQALLPRPCNECSIGFDQFNAIAQKHEYFNELKSVILARFTESEIHNLVFRNHSGCEKCSSGCDGYTVVAEVVAPSQEVLDLIKSAKIDEAFSIIKSEGGRTILDHALEKALMGHVDLCDVATQLGI